MEVLVEHKVAIESGNVLGEGPVWSEDEQALYWVDIQRRLLQRWEFATGSQKTWMMPSEIGSFAIRQKGGCIVALRTGFAFLDLSNGDIQAIYDPEPELIPTRFNDGKCDRRGRFWAGTMDEEYPKRRAGLYMLDLDGTCRRIRNQVGISNGLGWSPDNRIFYYTDSAESCIFAYDFDIETGEVANERIFASTPEGYVPDGLTVDSSGFIWSAKWDGWKVVRYAPNGSVDKEIPLPVQRPTSITFGGPEMKHIFITSASIGLSPQELDQQPNAGNVFVIETDIRGIPEPKFAG